MKLFREGNINKGFSAVTLVTVLAIISVIAVTGLYVYSQNEAKISEKTEDTPKTAEKIQLKNYSNEEYGFSFDYPAKWQLTENLKDIGREANEGEVIVTSPNDTKVYFNLNQGGKGGDCWDDEADAYTPRTCATRNIISIEKLSSSSDSSPIYFYKASMTEPTRDGGNTEYYIYAGNGEFTPTETGSTVGFFITYWAELTTLKNKSVGLKVEGGDAAKKSSSAYFDTQEVEEATPILKSIKFL